MTKRSGLHSHYELMFEEFLRSNEILYIAVDENRKPLVDGHTVKNFDFIVSSFNGKFLVDVKGKKFSARVWDNWVHGDDLTGLRIWGNHFNAFVPLLVIPYLVETKEDFEMLKKYGDVRKFKGQKYVVVAVTLSDFYSHAKLRSKKWKAIYVPKNEFIEICKPLSYFIPEFKNDWK